MAVLIDDTFDSGVSGWSNDSGSAPSHDTSKETHDFGTGCMAVPGNSQTTRTFTAPTSGTLRVDLWLRDDSTTTAAGSGATTNVYIRLNTSSPSSANSAAYAALNRDSGTSPAATATLVPLTYRNGAAFGTALSIRRDGGAWWKVSFVLDVAANAYDLYVNEALWVAGAAFPSTTKTTSGSITILSNASAPTTYIDDVRVESGWSAPAESTLVDHDFTAGATGQIEALTPTTDARSAEPQPWKVPDSSTYGAYTVANSTGAQPDSGKDCLALYRCAAEGVLEVEFATSATSADAYLAVWFRVWAGAGSDSYLGFRYWGNSANKFLLSQGSTALATAGSPTLATATVHTLRVEFRGRLARCSYKAAAMDSGSYTQVFGWTNVGNRGQLSEEHCGFFAFNSSVASTDNYARRFRFTGRVPDGESNPTVGDYAYNLAAGSIRELYAAQSGLPARNLFWSKGVQFGHRSEADMGNYAVARQMPVDGTHVKSYRQRSLMLRENAALGLADCRITLLRRGPWVADRVFVMGKPGASINYTPDTDLRTELWSDTIRHAGPSGAGSSATKGFATWADLRTISGSPYSPAAWQAVTSLGSGDGVRLTQVRTGIAGHDVANQITSKRLGNGDPFSIAFNVSESNLADGAWIECGRAVLLETGASIALDDATLTRFRDDAAIPADLSSAFAAGGGSLKDDADGDLDADGFNERHGWYEVVQGASALEFTFPMDGAAQRFMPAFRVWSYGLGADPSVTLGGSPAAAGVDYAIDDLGDGTAILQLLSSPTADLDVLVEAAGGSGSPAFGALDAAGSGLLATAGSGAPALGALVAAGTGEAFGRSASAAPTLGAIGAGGTGEAFGRSASAAASLAAVVAAGTGQYGTDVAGAGSPALAALDASGSGLLAFAGSGSPGLGKIGADGSGLLAFVGAASAALAGLDADGSGEAFAKAGSAAASLAGLDASAAGLLAFAGDASASLGGLDPSGSGQFGSDVAGSGAPALGGLDASGSGLLAFAGTASAALGAFDAAGSGSLTTNLAGSGSPALAGLDASGSGLLAFAGAPAATLAAIDAAGLGTLALLGSGAAALAGTDAAGLAALGEVLAARTVFGVVATPAAGNAFGVISTPH